MTCSLDLGDLLARARIGRDDRGRVELTFAYPCSDTGRPVERRLRRPVVFATAAGELRLSGYDQARGAPRTFDPTFIQTPTPPHPTTGADT